MRHVALDHWRTLIQAGVAQGAIDPGIDPDLAALMLNAVLNEIGVYVLQRLNIAPGTLHELDIALFQTPEVERIFDAASSMLEQGLGRPTARSTL